MKNMSRKELCKQVVAACRKAANHLPANHELFGIITTPLDALETGNLPKTSAQELHKALSKLDDLASEHSVSQILDEGETSKDAMAAMLLINEYIASCK